MIFTEPASRPASAADARTCPANQRMRSGSPIWSIAPSAIRPVSRRATGP